MAQYVFRAGICRRIQNSQRQADWCIETEDVSSIDDEPQYHRFCFITAASPDVQYKCNHGAAVM